MNSVEGVSSTSGPAAVQLQQLEHPVQTMLKQLPARENAQYLHQVRSGNGWACAAHIATGRQMALGVRRLGGLKSSCIHSRVAHGTLDSLDMTDYMNVASCDPHEQPNPRQVAEAEVLGEPVRAGVGCQ